MSLISQYLSDIQRTLRTGDAREHAYRPALQRFIEALMPDVLAINEPAYTGSNAPDFLFKRGEIPVSYAECKDVTVELSDKEVQKQATRYINAFGKILLTNYLEFRILDENGEVARIYLATKIGNDLILHEESFAEFESLIKDYITPTTRTIRSARKLAEIMASKARLLRDNSLAALKENVASDIFAQYQAFKEILIRDLSIEEFADMYAQTVVYGLFVARYFDQTLSDFSRHEAHDLLPSTNPLLKKFFGHVAGTDFDPKVAWMIDSLIEAYKSANVRELMHKEFERKQKDPLLHFYETFLSEYDEGLRKSRGVYYTPEPVVSFIVRSVDCLLKERFNLPKGLSDTTKVEHEFTTQGIDGRTKDGSKKVREEIHKVQILDPAVGTGTFLNEVVHEIYKTFHGQEGRWNGYVSKELLPRLHGFEIMMASYTMAHLKLGVTLRELGYEGLQDRLSIWLTNSLEESVHEVPNLFMSQWLTQESNQASRIKSEMPIMVVIGNPPYSISSSNKGEYIQGLISEYKKDLNERNIQPLSDDYIKFIRLAEYTVEKNGHGIVAMITNNSFIDGRIHRKMREHLTSVFDEIYILNLRGNAKKNEAGNVFNIQQGVSINIFIKTTDGTPSKVVKYFDLNGDQSSKFSFLNDNDVTSVSWNEIPVRGEEYFFVPKDFGNKEEFDSGFSLDEIFRVSSSGIKTHNDKDLVSFEKFEQDNEKYSYKPFDTRNIDYNLKKVMRHRYKVMKHVQGKENPQLILMKGLVNTAIFNTVFLTKNLVDINFFGFQSYAFPLFLYDDDNKKVANLDPLIWANIDRVAGKTSPQDVLGYIYALLHSSVYRDKYIEFLKIGFPSIPYPVDKDNFWELSVQGNQLQDLHTFESSDIDNFKSSYPIGGSSVIEKKFPEYFEGKVYINSSQYFGNVSLNAWEYSIGGNRPLYKWLKSRSGRALTDADIANYQRIIVSIEKTIEVIKNIDVLCGENDRVL